MLPHVTEPAAGSQEADLSVMAADLEHSPLSPLRASCSVLSHAGLLGFLPTLHYEPLGPLNGC